MGITRRVGVTLYPLCGGVWQAQLILAFPDEVADSLFRQRLAIGKVCRIVVSFLHVFNTIALHTHQARYMATVEILVLPSLSHVPSVPSTIDLVHRVVACRRTTCDTEVVK